MFPRRNLIAGIDEGSIADSRSVGQIHSQHIGSEPDGGVEIARGVEMERKSSVGGVEATRGVVKERTGTAGGVGVARGVENERIDSGRGVEGADGVAKEGI